MSVVFYYDNDNYDSPCVYFITKNGFRYRAHYNESVYHDEYFRV